MISRPELLAMIGQTVYLSAAHPLKSWAHNQVILPQDEFELDQWPGRAIDGLLAVCAGAADDPYLAATGIALATAAIHRDSPFPPGTTVAEALALTRRAADAADDPFLELLVANQARCLGAKISGRSKMEFDLIAWQLGCRLKDPSPIYVNFYLSALWQYWNSFPRAYALSGTAVPPARALVRHLAGLDGGQHRVLRSLLELKADLEIVISEMAISTSRSQRIRGADALSDAVLALLAELVDEEGAPTQGERGNGTYPVDATDLARICIDLGMALILLGEYESGCRHLAIGLSLGGSDQATEIVGLIQETITGYVT